VKDTRETLDTIVQPLTVLDHPPQPPSSLTLLTHSIPHQPSSLTLLCHINGLFLTHPPNSPYSATLAATFSPTLLKATFLTNPPQPPFSPTFLTHLPHPPPQ